MDPMDTLEPDTSLMPDVSLLYTPTDPGRHGTQALAHLQRCISRVAEHALAAGTPTNLIRNHISQNQMVFDAVLRTLDAMFQLRDLQLTTAMRSAHAAAPFSDGHPEAPPALLDPELPQLTASTTAIWDGHNEPASLHIGDNFPADPQLTPGNPDYLANRGRYLEVVALQRAQIDESRRAANVDMVGGWLEGIDPVSDDDVAQHFARSTHDLQDDAERSSTQSNPNKRRRTSVDQVDGNDAVDAVSVEETTANPVPARTQSESNVSPPAAFGSWTAQQRENSMRDLVLRPRHG